MSGIITASAAGVLALGAVGSWTVPQQGGEVPPCTSDQLKVSVAAPQPVAGTGSQYATTLTLKNISGGTCGVDGLPTVDLVGPEDPTFGGTFRLTEGADKGDFVALVPGEAEPVAEVTVLTPGPGGETWTPRTIQVTPPGQTSPLISEWPADLPVLRQDGATHPGSYVQGVGR
ncbi:hypothetical protein GCM10027445_09450 [Amycolatopsis endophytica]|uniref:DUF4232 domain-containing protein n=1 Tax=Amycolatopsis endophytica TaxID=860233 RepID=A0A853AWY4_9PSEU|nr:DUF4232 domain-containing protein [Amycolatopsis endophytica]NYI87182.1 hypothetical protein [Amycolatopsis endophytica]